MNICIFGDSIVWGANDYEKGGWAERLKLSFMEKDICLYNLGISGDSTKELLKRFKTEALSRDPSLIIFSIGTNDAQYIYSQRANKVSLDCFEKNLVKLLKVAKKHTEKIFFLGLGIVKEEKTKPIPWNIDKEYNNENIRKYNEVIKSFCLKNNLSFININHLLLDQDLDEDGLHFNSQGHEKIFKEVLKKIKI